MAAFPGAHELPRASSLLRPLCMAGLLAAALGLQAAPGPHVGHAQEAPGHRVHLVSRTFEPPPGLDARVEPYLRRLGAPQAHVLLQTWDLPDGPAREALAARGVRLLAYIPENTWIASVPASVPALRSLPGVRAVVVLTPDDKLSPGLKGPGVPPWSLDAGGDAELWLTHQADVSPDEAGRLVAGLAGRVVRSVPEANRLEIALPVRAIRTLVADDRVQWLAESPPPKQTANDGARAFLGLNSVQGPEGVFSGAAVQVAEWDGGAVGAHGDFENRVTVVDDVAADDHATHVAGSVLGAGVVQARARGMAPLAHLFSYDWNDPITEHQDAAARGAEVSTNSWIYGASKRYNSCYGTYNYGAPDYDDIVRGRYGKAILVLFAAGNSQETTDPCSRTAYDKIHVPATAKNIVTVGAIHSDDGTMTSFSSWGPTDDGRIKPEVVAPGCEWGGEAGIYSTLPGGTYAAWCGTSMATPVTSGVAATLYERWRATFAAGAPDVDPLPATIKAALVGTARDGGPVGPDYAFGFGAVDAAAAHAALASTRSVVEERDGLGNGGERSYAVQPDGGALKVTLVWSDVPAADNAAKTLVNDLDLSATAPDDSTVLPWTLDPAAPSAPAVRGADHTNVVEQVEIEGPQAGTYVIRVRGHAVPSGPQPYSLVLSGGSFVTSAHDVAVADLDVPVTVVAGNLVDVAVTVANRGTESETAAALVLTDDTAGTTIGTTSLDLAAGESRVVTFPWSVPTVEPVDRVLRAVFGPVADEPADAQADNTATAATTIRPPIRDLAVASLVAAPNPARPGDTVVATAYVANLGDTSETARVAARVVAPATDLGTQEVQLGPGEAAQLSFLWDSTGLSEETYTIEAALVADGGYLDDDATNDVATDAVTLASAATWRGFVATGADDVFAGCAFSPSLNEITLGEDDCKDRPLITAGLRFTGLEIPAGATIRSARVEVTSASNYSVGVRTRVAAEASGAPEPFSGSHTPDGVPLTAATASWDITAPWAYMERVATTDIAAVLQELVDRDDWSAPGDANLVIETISTGGARVKHRRFFAYERQASEAAELIVDYAP